MNEIEVDGVSKIFNLKAALKAKDEFFAYRYKKESNIYDDGDSYFDDYSDADMEDPRNEYLTDKTWEYYHDDDDPFDIGDG
jgi:hypothetical protein